MKLTRDTRDLLEVGDILSRTYNGKVVGDWKEIVEDIWKSNNGRSMTVTTRVIKDSGNKYSGVGKHIYSTPVSELYGYEITKSGDYTEEDINLLNDLGITISATSSINCATSTPNGAYAYEKRYLQQSIDDILDGYGDSEGILLNCGGFYGVIFHSDMTGMDVAIISKNMEDVIGITDDDFMNWLDAGSDAEESGESFDWGSFNGLPIVDDENGDLAKFDTAVLFTDPLETYVTDDETTVNSILDSSIGEFDNVYYTTPDSLVYPHQHIQVVGRSHFRF